VTSAPITTHALEEIRPGWYNQDTSMAGRYGAGVDIRRTIIPFPHSASTLGEDHISIHIEKKHYQRDKKKEQNVVKTCRPNSKRTQLSRL
jgi:hypothetical protein